ncbi:hypothetical protein HPB50_012587 [Hyalomma asiaticum]|uniref:Uncharacterized protein n=1 Tax=Hyalomma asiaticum TaxID=266040 RepID=A0ACB7S2C5_HYAAI|nr:hypothetical protein HPB50_012587 [Hyalomma asiaticum]
MKKGALGPLPARVIEIVNNQGDIQKLRSRFDRSPSTRELGKKSGGTLPGTAATRRGEARLPGEGHRASADARERNAEGLAPPGDERFGALVTRANRPGIARGSGTRRPWPSRRLGHGDSTHPGTMRGPPHTPLSRRRWEAERKDRGSFFSECHPRRSFSERDL